MAETAAHLVDHVFPWVPVRQWVLSLPFGIRFAVAYNRDLCRDVRRIFVRTVLGFLKRHAKRNGIDDPYPGAVCFTQRWDSALNLNPHYHLLALDGVSTQDSLDEPPVFHPLPQLDDLDIGRLAFKIRTKVLRLLRKKGLLDDDDLIDYDTLSLDEPILASCYAASVQGKVALGPHRGERVTRLGRDPEKPVVDFPSPRCAQAEGFSLHADVRIATRDRPRLERLCRYVARPPIAQQRLSLNHSGQVVYEFKRPFRDGSTAVVFEPETFVEKLCALVPPPRAHLVTYHGVLAPAAGMRPDIVPAQPPRPQRPCGGEAETVPRSSRPRIPWAELLRRVLKLEVLVCPHCQGPRRVIAMITQPEVIEKILRCLGLPTEPPVVQQARPPPAEFLF